MYTRSLYKHKGLYNNRKVEYAGVMFDTFFQQGVLKGKHNGIKGAITKYDLIKVCLFLTLATLIPLCFEQPHTCMCMFC